MSLHGLTKHVIPVKPWLSRMPGNRRHGDVERFARGGEVNLDLSALVGPFQGFAEESAHGLPDSALLVSG